MEIGVTRVPRTTSDTNRCTVRLVQQAANDRSIQSAGIDSEMQPSQQSRPASETAKGRMQGEKNGGMGMKSRCIMSGEEGRSTSSLFQSVDVSAVRSTCASAADAAAVSASNRAQNGRRPRVSLFVGHGGRTHRKI